MVTSVLPFGRTQQPLAPVPYVPPAAQTQAPTLWRGAAPTAIQYADVETPATFGSSEEVRRAGQAIRQAGAGLTGQARAEAIERARPRGALQRMATNLRQYDPSAGLQQKGNIQYTTVQEALTQRFPFAGTGMGFFTDEAGAGLRQSELQKEAASLLAQRKGPTNVLGMPLEGSQTDLSRQSVAERQARGSQFARQAKMAEELKQQRAQLPVWQQLQNLQKQGVAYKNPQGGSEAQMDNIVRELSRWGITDLGQVGSTTDASGKTVIYNRMTGQALPERIGSGSAGKGFTEYKWMAVPGGGAIPVSKWEESSDRGKIAQALAIGAGLLAPAALGPLAGVLGGTAAGAAPGLAASIGAGALYGGATSVLPAAIAGGNVGKALLGGALGGGIGAGVAAYNPAAQMGVQNKIAQQAINQAISGGLRGGVSSAIQKQPVGIGALGGAIAGGVGGAAAPIIGGPLGGIVGQQLGKRVARGALSRFMPEGQG